MDQGSTNMFLLANYNGDQAGKGELRFGQVLGSASSPSLAVDRVLAVTGSTWRSFLSNNANFGPQQGATNLIHLGDARMRATTQKNGVIYAAHMIYIPATNPVRSVIQYFKMQRNGAFIREIIDDGSSFYAYPNISVNDFGDVLIGYAKFNTNIYPSAAFKIKYYNEQEFSTENVFAPGEAEYKPVLGYDSRGRLRWGDYTAAGVDPENGRDFWTLGEYSKLTTNGFSYYSTRWAKVQLFSPTNDFFIHGVNISGAASTNTVLTERITREAGETNHLGTNYVSVWYNWTAPASGQVNISAGNSSVATALAVYTGGTVIALSLVAQSAHASSRSAPVKEISNVIFTASSNQTYRIAVLLHPNETEPTEIRLQQQVAPLFITHPSPATNSIIEGYSVTLSGSAIGNPAPSYQWKKNGVEISGATNATHTISSMASGNEGLYTLSASNTFGSATSNGSYLKYFSSGATPIESPVWTNGAFRLSLNDVVGYDYIIYASTNLQTWLPVYTNTVPFSFPDPQSTNYPFRFYRSKFIP